MRVIVGALVSYILGSFPSAYIVTKLRTGLDIREIGSKNMGTGNVFHSVGKIEGLLVLLLDAGKGSLTILFLNHILNLPSYLSLLISLFAVVGHVFPVFLNFKGGRGAATTLGIQLTFIFDYLKERGFYVFLPILVLYLIFIVVSKSQVVSLFFVFPIYPFLLFIITKDFKLFLVSVIFVIVVEIFGFKTFKREFKKILTKKKENP